MKRICYYSILTQLGGAEKSLLDLVTRLESQSEGRYSPLVLLPRDSGPLIDALKRHHIAYEVLPMPPAFLKTSRSSPLRSGALLIESAPRMLKYFMQLCWHLRHSSYALIHTTGVKCHELAALSRTFDSTPVLWHLRDIFPPGPTRTMLQTSGKIAGVHMIANSYSTRDSIAGAKEIPVIYNGLDESVYFPDANPDLYRSIFKVTREIPIVGILGILTRWKGQLEFIRMARRLVDLGVEARFVVMGSRIYDTVSDTNYEQELRDLVQELKLEKHVYFTGHIDQPEKALNGVDLLVHASVKPEPFGRVVIEAMACGVPVVASNAGGIPELIDDTVNGLLFAPSNVEQMTKKVETLLKDHARRKTCIENGIKRFHQKFTIEAHVNQMIGTYDQITQ